MKQIIRILFLLSGISFAFSAHSAAYYADNSLGADCATGNYSAAGRNCTGSDGNAYTNIQSAVNAATLPGDTVNVRSGTYAERVSTAAGGSDAEHYITIQRYGEEAVVLNSSTTSGFTINHDYVKVDGFEITGSCNLGNNYGFISIGENADYAHVSDNYIHDGESGDTCVGMQFRNTSTHATISNNALRRLRYMYIWVNGSYHLLENNIIEGFGDAVGNNANDYDAFWLHGERNTIQGNSISNLDGSCGDHKYVYGDGDGKRYRCIAQHAATPDNRPPTGGSWAAYWEEDAGWTGYTTTWSSGTTYRIDCDSCEQYCGTNHTDFMQTAGNCGATCAVSRYHIIDGNFVYNCKTTQILMSSQDSQSGIGDWTFRNNIFSKVGLRANVYMPNVKFYNNTFYQIEHPSYGGLSQWAIQFNSSGTGVSSGGEAYNNIFLDTGATNACCIYVDTDGASAVHDYNYHAGAGPAYTARTDSAIAGEGHDVGGGNPYSSNTGGLNAEDYALTDLSVLLLDRGTSLAGFSNDYAGSSRPQGSAWDIGAYEYASGGDATAPASPGGLTVS